MWFVFVVSLHLIVVSTLAQPISRRKDADLNEKNLDSSTNVFPSTEISNTEAERIEGLKMLLHNKFNKKAFLKKQYLPVKNKGKKLKGGRYVQTGKKIEETNFEKPTVTKVKLFVSDDPETRTRIEFDDAAGLSFDMKPNTRVDVPSLTIEVVPSRRMNYYSPKRHLAVPTKPFVPSVTRKLIPPTNSNASSVNRQMAPPTRNLFQNSNSSAKKWVL